MTAVPATEHVALSDAAGAAKPTELEATWFWLKLGCISFGGPAGQIAITALAVFVARHALTTNSRVVLTCAAVGIANTALR